MSYFSLQQRKLHEEHRSNKYTGPGTYGQQLGQSKRLKQSFAPFGSLTLKGKRRAMVQQLGPGAYNVQTSIISPGISKYQNQKCVIVKINGNGSPQFKSGSLRFKQQINYSPGPGEYELLGPRLRKKNLSVRLPKRPKPYTPICKPDLTLGQAEEKPKEDQPIPKKVGRKIIDWKNDKSKRFSQSVKEKLRAEDKLNFMSQIQQKKKKKETPNAVFKSKSLKSHLEGHMFKTTDPLKVEIYQKIHNFKDSLPGPGTYDLTTTFSASTLNQKYDYFGSTVERFEYNSDEQRGPGSYMPEKNPCSPKRPPKNQLKINRCSYIQLSSENPGPGSYDLERPTVNHRYDIGKQSFGTRQERFIEPSGCKEAKFHSSQAFMLTEDDENRLQKKKLAIQLLKQYKATAKSSVFISETKRCYTDPTQKTPFAIYNVSQNNISARAEKDKKINFQLEACNVTKPGFLSTTKRFLEDNLPQQTEHHCWCNSKSVDKHSMEHESPAFLSKDERIAFRVNKEAPPVGTYEHKGGLLKQSFNSRFLRDRNRAAESFNSRFLKEGRDRTKKLKIWSRRSIVT